MHRRIVLAIVLLIVGCGEAPPEEPSTPSPLVTADSDRLWILARAARVGNGKECKELYLHPDDPRYRDRSRRCDFWARGYVDYLRVNGFPTVEALHLKDPAYWRWFLNKRKQIANCKSALGNLPLGLRDADKRRQHQYGKNQCDPYDHARINQELTPEDLGIRFN